MQRLTHALIRTDACTYEFSLAYLRGAHVQIELQGAERAPLSADRDMGQPKGSAQAPAAGSNQGQHA
eukprot:476412-Pleurochrysis_carterae.AAC.1